MIFRRRSLDGPEGAAGSPILGDPRAVLCDELGLCHLWYLELRLHEELARSARLDRSFSLAMWRLRLLPGETPSMELTQQAAAITIAHLRNYDLAARVDPERTVALLFDAEMEDAATVAFRIKSELQTRIRSAGRWQAGVASFPGDGLDGNGLIQTAFRRLEADARAAA